MSALERRPADAVALRRAVDLRLGAFDAELREVAAGAARGAAEVAADALLFSADTLRFARRAARLPEPWRSAALAEVGRWTDGEARRLELMAAPPTLGSLSHWVGLLGSGEARAALEQLGRR